MNRRELLKTALAGAAAISLPATGMRPSLAGASTSTDTQSPTVLRVVRRNIEVKGRAANVFGLTQANGKSGVELPADTNFNVLLRNETAEPTIVHWHGLTPPWQQDGVPDAPAPLLQPKSERKFDFPAGRPGTHWMHAHTLQEQNLLAAPLIVTDPADKDRDEQSVVILLHDFSFTSAEELLARLQRGAGGHGAMGGMAPMSGMDHSSMARGPQRGPMAGTAMGMDLNDVEYDAYLANDRTLDDPEVVRVENGGKVRLRIINGATATAFTIDLGGIEGTLIAVDGQDVVPVAGRRFPVAMGQRLDLRLKLPRGAAAFPVLALREGAPERTGIILAPQNATVRKIASAGESAGPVVDLALERTLRAARPLAVRQPDRRFNMALVGGMQGYTWGLQTAPALVVTAGSRAEVTMSNKSMMAHPMHLHGHHFQVVAIDGKRLAGAVRDTVHIPPQSAVTVAFDANNAGQWALHCHHLYHMAAGMMTTVKYDA